MTLTLLLNRDLVRRAKLCLVSVFPDIVKDCSKMRNKTFLRSFENVTPADLRFVILCRRATVIRHGLVSARRQALTILAVPRTRTKFGDTVFSVAGPVVWNSLPAAVREADSLCSFKRKVKTHLFSVCFML